LPNTGKTKFTKKSLKRKTGTIKEASKIEIYTPEIVHCDDAREHKIRLLILIVPFAHNNN